MSYKIKFMAISLTMRFCLGLNEIHLYSLLKCTDLFFFYHCSVPYTNFAKCSSKTQNFNPLGNG